MTSSKKINKQLTKIILYNDPSTTNLDLIEIKNYLKEKLGNIKIIIQKDFRTHNLKKEDIDKYSENFARCKVRNLTEKNNDIKPLIGEINFEKQLLISPEKKPYGILYEGNQLSQILFQLIPKEEQKFNILHIIFTNRLIGTYDQNDLRYHARVIHCSYPTIISTTGIIEAPAKPKEYYIQKQQNMIIGRNIPLDVLKKQFKGQFIDYNDPRLTETMKGYVLQSVFYHLTYKPFCESKNCRLYNAHWQKEVIHAQLKKGKLCEKHEKILKKFRNTT